MRPGIETGYINRIDKPSEEEVEQIGLAAEEVVLDFYNNSLEGFRARPSTLSEDSGLKDIGPKQTIDAVIYRDKKPAMGIQITTAEDPKTRQKKMAEIMSHPFIRLAEMKNTDTAIPKTLVYIKRETAKAHSHDGKINQEEALQVLDGSIKSLKFCLSQTKDKKEQLLVNELLKALTAEQKNLLH
jgi:hypothetical protein